MIRWTPEPRHASRPIDRPAVAIILTLALFIGALLGLYAAHVLTDPPAPTAGDDTAAVRYLPSWSPPVCSTHRRGHAGVTRRPIPAVPCHVTTYRRGTV